MAFCFFFLSQPTHASSLSRQQPYAGSYLDRFYANLTRQLGSILPGSFFYLGSILFLQVTAPPAIQLLFSALFT
jgi:hypothetical protein